ncbi:MHS family alpha-ketoglutarate permease-like MFS transporter [Prauserella sediminis]|uniref:MHS family alpha-ketoglutarate permease-like MFS transporter n=1 Tax=Prauserella sediminis TaxID=577680 RepID=A0A839XMY1_9PSEU|nr:MFS transporter [Prauserella sediminis]MBB3664620.1 MHS family alpha-ketoglutarate permease-like MFS transporter [Prauserella sediminis]
MTDSPVSPTGGHVTETDDDTVPDRARTLFGLGAGNAMEWFDWTVYATFASFFAGQFFNNEDSVSALLSTLAVFAVGFAARPLGGFVFGWVADRKGRQVSMALCLALAAGGSLVIGLSPTYEQIGLGASALLLLARLGQGLAHGGELPAAQTYIAEVAPRKRRGLWSSLIYFSGTCGVLAGTLLGALLSGVLTQEQMYSYGWRVPFILGGVFGLYSLYVRLRMRETEVFLAENDEENSAEPKGRMWDTIKQHPKLLFQVIGMTVGATVLYYVWAISAPSYAISVHGIDPTSALWAGVGAQVLFLISLPLWGMLSDRIGRKPVLFIASGGLLVTSIPLDALLGDQAWQLFLAMSIALLLMGGFSSIAPAIYAEMFPTRIRAVGLGLPYAIAVAAFGGTAPYLQTLFADLGNPSLFLFYAMGLMVITILVLFTLPETRGIDLSSDDVGAHGRRKSAVGAHAGTR